MFSAVLCLFADRMEREMKRKRMLQWACVLVLLAWQVSEKSISVSHIETRRAEGFY